MVTQKYTLSILNDSVGGQDGTPQTHPQTRKNTKWHPQNPCHDWGLPVEHLYHPPPLPPHNPTPRTSVLLPQRTSVPPVGITEPTDCLLNILSHRNYTTTNTFNTMIEWQTTHTHTHWMIEWHHHQQQQHHQQCQQPLHQEWHKQFSKKIYENFLTKWSSTK